MVGVADRLSLDEHLAVVREGRGNMPAGTARLTDEEIEAVVDYERDVLSGDAGGDDRLLTGSSPVRTSGRRAWPATGPGRAGWPLG